jgi:predicted enzyme related to lactoylglutathione lyase
MITGVHAIVYSPEAERVRTFFADVLGTTSVDAHDGWPIFALPPAELAVHPAERTSHQLYLMCDEIHSTLAELTAKGVEVLGEVSDERFGLLASLRLPDGSEFGIYEPKHPSPLA